MIILDNILFINACARPQSRTLSLAKSVLYELGEYASVDLYSMPIKPLDNEDIVMRHEASLNKDFSNPYFDLAKQFATAKTVVIAAPYWDLLFPAVLRTYLEAVTVSGITFEYLPSGMPKGLCQAEKVYYVTTAGGFIGNNNFGFEYIKGLSKNLYGIENAVLISAEGLDVNPDKAEEILTKVKENIKNIL